MSFSRSFKFVPVVEYEMISSKNTSVTILENESFNTLNYGGDFSYIFYKFLIFEAGYHHNSYYFYDNSSVPIANTSIETKTIKAGIGIQSTNRFGGTQLGVIKFLYKKLFHSDINYLDTVFKGSGNFYQVDISFGSKSSVGVTFNYENSQFSGSYDLIHEERSIGLYTRILLEWKK